MGKSPLPTLPPREPNSHKGTYGHVLLIGGSRGMSGSISLSGMAALRSGAGLVTVAVPDVCLENVALFEPSYMTLPLPCDGQGRISRLALPALEEALSKATVVGLGPGLGRSDELGLLVRELTLRFPRPMVIDADGLNALGTLPLSSVAAGPRILTPHPGEMKRLIGRTLENSEPETLRRYAESLAASMQWILVLKGHQTLVTDGAARFLNETGNPGMATAGSGDVLTGIVCGLLAQGLSPLDAARLAVHAHGIAGDLAAREKTQTAMIARDLIEQLPATWRKLGAP